MPAFDNNVDFGNLIPELKAWNNGEGIDIDQWIACEGDHKHLIGCARILWPNCGKAGPSMTRTTGHFWRRLEGTKQGSKL